MAVAVETPEVLGQLWAYFDSGAESTGCTEDSGTGCEWKRRIQFTMTALEPEAHVGPLSRLLTVQAFGKPVGIMWVAYNWPRWEYLNHGNWQMLHIRALLPAHPLPRKPGIEHLPAFHGSSITPNLSCLRGW